jgi:hypothetical protein
MGTLFENAHGATKELIAHLDRPLGTSSYAELPILMRFLPKMDVDFVYVVASIKENEVVLLLHVKPGILLCMLDPSTTQNWVENKFESYRAMWHKAHAVAELVLEVHRVLREGIDRPV